MVSSAEPESKKKKKIVNNSKIRKIKRVQLLAVQCGEPLSNVEFDLVRGMNQMFGIKNTYDSFQCTGCARNESELCVESTKYKLAKMPGMLKN